MGRCESVVAFGRAVTGESLVGAVLHLRLFGEVCGCRDARAQDRPDYHDSKQYGDGYADECQGRPPVRIMGARFGRVGEPRRPVLR